MEVTNAERAARDNELKHLEKIYKELMEIFGSSHSADGRSKRDRFIIDVIPNFITRNYRFTRTLSDALRNEELKNDILTQIILLDPEGPRRHPRAPQVASMTKTMGASLKKNKKEARSNGEKKK